jgi:pathogenesis-related protein 1
VSACAQHVTVGGPTAMQPAAIASSQGATSGEWVEAHNSHRRKKNLPALNWSAELAHIAQEWVNTLAATQCGNLEHRSSSYLNPRNLGENLASASSNPMPPTQGPTSAVDDWAGEEQFYDYGSNQCQTGKVCGHYTQVVWRDTQEVGCGEASCRNGEWSTKMWVCNYRPAGNFVGRKPY